MARRRDPLDSSLSRLCSLAEQTTVLLRDIPVARAGFQRFRFDPDALADELTRLATAGRAAHTDRLDRVQWADVAEEEAREVAQEAYDVQSGLRDRLQAVAVILDDPIAADDLAEARRRIRLRSPRLTGALSTYRQVRLHLDRPDHPAHHHEATASLLEEVSDLEARLEAAFRARDTAYRLRRIAAARADDAWADLRRALRRVRQMGEVVATLSSVPESLFSHLQTQRSPRPAPPEPSCPAPTPEAPREPGAVTREPGAITREPGTTPSDPGAITRACGTTPREPGTTPREPGTRSNLDSHPCPDPDDP